MDMIELFREVVKGASMATLDVAGTVFLPGAWPILRGALTPVLDRLSERFEGKDVTSSPELAERAAQEFARDERLQELFKSNLLDALDPVIKKQKNIGGDVQILCEIAMENTKALVEISSEVDKLGNQLDRGVHLNEEGMNELCDRLLERVVVNQEVRNFERQQITVYPSTKPLWMSRDQIKSQISQVQVAAVELIRQGRIEQAMDNLKEVQALLGHSLEETPTDVTIKVLQGYFFKTMAQAFHAVGRKDSARQYIELAEKVFNLIADDLPADQKTLNDAAGAINGLGNVYHLMGEYEKAILSYKRATTLCPDYAYAWHDLFGAYDALACRGVLNLEEMQHAYLKLRETAGVGLPGLGPEYLAQLERRLHGWEQRP